MIIKNIFKHKPVIVPPITPPYNYQNSFPKLCRDQLEFNVFLDNVHVKEKQYVCARNRIVLNDLWGVYYVRYIETNFDSIKCWSSTGQPQAVHALQLGNATIENPTFFEWISGTSFRSLTGDEFTKLVNVHVLDYIKTRLEAYDAVQRHQSAC